MHQTMDDPGSWLEKTGVDPEWSPLDMIDGGGGGPSGPSNPGGNVNCMVGCCWENLNQSNYQCVNPADGGAGCSNAWQIYYGLAACQAACGGSCFCDNIGQGDSGNSAWVPHYQYMNSSACAQYSVGNVNCCNGQTSLDMDGSCNCNSCNSGPWC
tara:strand:- start:707 stop:1171 length:465 start_codon:yes stop_codon:yes gene_type:complete